MDNFTIVNALTVSLFSMSVVFVVLLILSIILSLFSKLITAVTKKEEVSEIKEVIESDDAEERLVAQIVASCLLQNNQSSNVRIKSIVRVK